MYWGNKVSITVWSINCIKSVVQQELNTWGKTVTLGVGELVGVGLGVGQIPERLSVIHCKQSICSVRMWK